eukprot:10855673-Karenia_brevis.AAC.1
MRSKGVDIGSPQDTEMHMINFDASQAADTVGLAEAQHKYRIRSSEQVCKASDDIKTKQIELARPVEDVYFDLRTQQL